MKKKALVLIGVVTLAAVMLLSGTFAWFTATDSVKNHLATADALANVSVKETFVEPGDWKPGQSITKEAGAINTGSAPALVRISFDELLKVNQPPLGETGKYDNTQATATKKPKLFDATYYTTGANGYIEYTTAAQANLNGLTIAGLPTGVKAYVKLETSAATGNAVDSYSFAFWAPISGISYKDTATPPAYDYTVYNTKNQAITFEREWAEGTKTLTLKNVKYSAYQGELNSTLLAWTAKKPLVADVSKSIAETALNTAGLGATHYPNNIVINYDKMITTLAGTAADKSNWYYNAADGYFYYIGLVEPGKATTNLIKSLTLKDTADSDYYANLSFDLTVKLEAVQHTKAAVAAKWTTVAANANLKAALEALCES